MAQAFVPSPNVLCDQVVLLDGTLTNVMAENLVWRPQWYAWKYARQCKIEQPRHYWNLAVENIDTGVRYQSIIEAGISEGLLFDSIWRSTYSGDPVYPNNHIFEIAEGV